MANDNKNLTIAVIQARMSSTRLPGKVLHKLDGKPVLTWVIESAKKIEGVDKIIVATSNDKSDDVIAKFCKSNSVDVFRGHLEDVLSRFAAIARKYKPKYMLRITADCPLLDSGVAAQVLQLLKTTKSDYTSNTAPPTWPNGLDVEAFTSSALLKADKAAKGDFFREHLTSYIYSNRQSFKISNLECPLPGLANERWTLDTEEDLLFLKEVTKRLRKNKFKSYISVLEILDKEPKLRKINSNLIRNESTIIKSIPKRITNFKNSAKLLTQAEKLIPLGSQTFSKSKLQFPVGHAPLFLTHGEGSNVWDVDGNKYIDLINGLLPVVLGYNDPDINYAIKSQIDNGISFSLATKLEYDLAQRLVDIIPCAEKVRFGKNGSDVTSAAIRLARAYTGRDRVIVCGYHGWHDWYIGSTTRKKGVPKAVQDLTHTVAYNDLESVEKLLQNYKNEFAAMIMEPINFAPPQGNYLKDLQNLLKKSGVVLIFDEIVSGFRMALGGGQEYLGITPDLATFGKAMGNGMPISAVTGRADIMNEMEEIFFSGTFGGETLSLAAAIALIDKLKSHNVIKTIWSTGNKVKQEIQKLIDQNKLAEYVVLKGHAPLSLVELKGNNNIEVPMLRTLFIKEMVANGILINSTNNISFAHNKLDILKITEAYSTTFKKMAKVICQGNISEELNGVIIQPVFKVR